MWALTPLFSPLLRSLTTESGIVSVALSLGFPPVAVSNCLSLRCPDFPHVRTLQAGYRSCDQPIVWPVRYYNTYAKKTELLLDGFSRLIKRFINSGIGQLVELAGHVRK
jgi:hypothetical protein